MPELQPETWAALIGAIGGTFIGALVSGLLGLWRDQRADERQLRATQRSELRRDLAEFLDALHAAEAELERGRDTLIAALAEDSPDLAKVNEQGFGPWIEARTRARTAADLLRMSGGHETHQEAENLVEIMRKRVKLMQEIRDNHEWPGSNAGYRTQWNERVGEFRDARVAFVSKIDARLSC